MAGDLICCFLNKDSNFCCVHFWGSYALIYLTSHANTARMFNVVHSQVSLGIATTTGPNRAYWAHSTFPSVRELWCSLGEPSVLLSVCSAGSSERQPAATRVNRDTPRDLELVEPVSCHGRGTRQACWLPQAAMASACELDWNSRLQLLEKHLKWLTNS